MKILVPKISQVCYKESKSKNIVLQVIENKKELDFTIKAKDRSGLLLDTQDGQYYITCNKKNLPDYSNILLTNIRPTQENIDKSNLIIKNWLKHPRLKAYTVEEIVESWKDKFKFIEENPEIKKLGLRQPQIGAVHMLMGHLTLPQETGTVVLPTGTGKTETMLSILVAKPCKRVLVIVPSDSLRNQIATKFQEFGLLKQLKIIPDDLIFPKVGILYENIPKADSLKLFLEASNVIVTTMNILSMFSTDHKKVIDSLCSHIFIDEAHHVKAATWTEFKESFSPIKVIQFTATPFRNDGKRLDGKIIYNFHLKDAQQQGYFKRINFIPVRQFDIAQGDIEIAKNAIQQLRKDLSMGFDHILMARCENRERAKKIFKLYENEKDLNPVSIYTNCPDYSQTYRKIINRQTRIIVCVNMLGEGFDLPELKIAAFHDIRKSLPITLQFAGRFTRTRRDNSLGEASFIANIADPIVKDELDELYSRDADWNEILSNVSYGRIKDEIDFKDLISGFSKINQSPFPFQNLRVKLSTVVYKNKIQTWNPLNFYKAIPNWDNLFFKFYDINRDENLLVIVTGDTLDLDWIKHKNFYIIDWKLIVIFWDQDNNLLFINSSDNSSLYQELAHSVTDEKTELIKGITVFKTFYNVKRTRLQNVGLKYYLGKNIRFRMMVGSDVGEALSIAEKQQGEKAFVMGIGFENGEPVNLGSSYKGRIWAKLDGNLKSYKKWCSQLGAKLVDESIDPNQILKDTLIPKLVIDRPSIYPVWIDWDIEMYLYNESRLSFIIDSKAYNISETDLKIIDPDLSGNIIFGLQTEDKLVSFELVLFTFKNGEDTYPDFKIIQKNANPVEVIYGNQRIIAEKFFQKYTPTIWFADGSALTGNEFIELKQGIGEFPRENILVWDWTGVDLSNESQGVSPLITDSIQYRVISKLITQDFDIVYDDDNSGEIADIIAIKQYEDKLKINLYHLKYAKKGIVSNRIDNLYEVCGQAQKSTHWKHKSGREFFAHLLRRINKKKDSNSRNRLEKGTEQNLERLHRIAKKEIPIEYEIFIIQPGFSKLSCSSDILILLGVTDNYIKETAAIKLSVIAND
jgi:superfamily II DNA or RNA helicase